MKRAPDPRLNNPLTLGQFIQAFGIYMNIMCDTYPARRQELDLYERDIVDMATKYNGKGFYEYRKAFSAQAAAHLKFSNKKVDWSIRNDKLFASIFVNQPALSCYLCQSSLHMTAFCLNQLNKGNFKIRQTRLILSPLIIGVESEFNTTDKKSATILTRYAAVTIQSAGMFMSA